MTVTTASSTPRLSEVARHVVIPDGIVTTAWPRVVKQCEAFGVEFDEWQHGLGRIALGKRADGMYAATVGGIVMSIPRQVGKTFFVGMVIIALCVLVPGLTVIWTAHHGRTSTRTFNALKAITSRPRISPHMEKPRNSNGEQEVRFRNGSVIMFGARKLGFGRGFDEVDVEIFDEAQILAEKTLDDMVPATNQSRQPAGALLFFMGTPPKPSDPGEEFTSRRKKALARETSDMVYVEFSADEGADPEDDAQRRKANPSYPARTSLESMERMRANLSPDSYMREAFEIWPDTNQRIPPTISSSLWRSRGSEAITPDGARTYAVRYSVDGLRVAMSVGVRVGDEVHVELIDVADTIDGVAQTAEWMAARRDTADAFVIDGKSHRDLLVGELVKAGVRRRMIITPTVDQVIAAHSAFLDAVQSGGIVHWLDELQEVLDDSVAHATKRKIGQAGGWGWAPIGDGEVVPLESATLAFWGASSQRKRRSGQAVFR